MIVYLLVARKRVHSLDPEHQDALEGPKVCVFTDQVPCSDLKVLIFLHYFKLIERYLSVGEQFWCQ